jgi:Holliday junction resolvase RusA-like endonuclease
VFTVRFDMPLPPRTNSLWRRARRGMILNPAEAGAYAASIAAARAAALRTGTVSVGVEVSLVFYIERRGSDTDARVKSALDAMQKAGLLVDDQQVCRVAVERRLAGRGAGRVEVVITRCMDPALLTAWDARIARAASCGEAEYEAACAAWATGKARVRARR